MLLKRQRAVIYIGLSILLLISSLQYSKVAAKAEEDEGDVQDDDDDSADAKKASAAPKQPKETYKPPSLPSGSLMAETFDGSSAEIFARWIKSKAKKSGGERYDGVWGVEQPDNVALQGDQSLVIKTKAKHHAVSSRLNRPFDFTQSKQLVVQYEVKFSQGMECGGAYMKLLSAPIDSTEGFYDKTPFSIMFGPDKCGNEQKLHFIIRFKNPISGKFEEKHMKRPEGFDLAKLVGDKRTHLFTLILNGEDQSYEVLVDQKRVKYGLLTSLTDFDPPIVPPKEIDDPKDKKPKDWDDRVKISDPEAKKPEDWDEDEPEYIVDKDASKPSDWLENEEKMIKDPTATKPDDWEDDMDGEWEAPLIDNPKCAGRSGCGKWEQPKQKNPKYKGKWSAPMIDNPGYKGEWKPRKIENPEYFEEESPFTKLTAIDAVGFELWTMTDGVYFDNILVADNKAASEKFALETYRVKSRIEGASALSVVQALLEALQDRPWLWIVVVIVVAIPSALLIAYCCFSASPRQQIDDAVGRRKKTDGAAQAGGNGVRADEAEEDDDEEDDDEMPELEAQDEEVGEEQEGEEQDSKGDAGVRHRHK